MENPLNRIVRSPVGKAVQVLVLTAVIAGCAPSTPDSAQPTEVPPAPATLVVPTATAVLPIPEAPIIVSNADAGAAGVPNPEFQIVEKDDELRTKSSKFMKDLLFYKYYVQEFDEGGNPHNKYSDDEIALFETQDINKYFEIIARYLKENPADRENNPYLVKDRIFVELIQAGFVKPHKSEDGSSEITDKDYMDLTRFMDRFMSYWEKNSHRLIVLDIFTEDTNAVSIARLAIRDMELNEKRFDPDYDFEIPVVFWEEKFNTEVNRYGADVFGADIFALSRNEVISRLLPGISQEDLYSLAANLYSSSTEGTDSTKTLYSYAVNYPDRIKEILRQLYSDYERVEVLAYLGMQRDDPETVLSQIEEAFKVSKEKRDYIKSNTQEIKAITETHPGTSIDWESIPEIQEALKEPDLEKRIDKVLMLMGLELTYGRYSSDISTCNIFLANFFNAMGFYQIGHRVDSRGNPVFSGGRELHAGDQYALLYEKGLYFTYKDQDGYDMFDESATLNELDRQMTLPKGERQLVRVSLLSYEQKVDLLAKGFVFAGVSAGHNWAVRGIRDPRTGQVYPSVFQSTYNYSAQPALPNSYKVATDYQSEVYALYFGD